MSHRLLPGRQLCSTLRPSRFACTLLRAPHPTVSRSPPPLPLSYAGQFAAYAHFWKRFSAADTFAESLEATEEKDESSRNREPLADEVERVRVKDGEDPAEQNDKTKAINLIADAVRHDAILHQGTIMLGEGNVYPQNGQTRIRYWKKIYSLLGWRGDMSRPDALEALKIHRDRATAFIAAADVEASKIKWKKMGGPRETFGLSILVGSLTLSAADALITLQCIPAAPVNFDIRADSLFNLRNARWEEIEADANLRSQYWSLAASLRDVALWPDRYMNTKHLDLLLENADQERERQILSAYLDLYENLPDYKLLYVVDRYIRLKDIDAALSVLRRVSQKELQKKSGPATRRCTNLLELETVERNRHSHSFKVLPAILELGIQPDDLIYDVVAQNSVKLNLPAVAWDIFRYARNQGATASQVTHLVLLKDSYLRRDANSLNEMLTIIHQSRDLYQHPPIVAYMMNIVRGICVHERRCGPAESLARMLAVYDKAYTRAPLARLGMIQDEQVQQGSPELPEPDARSLAFTVFSYVMVQQRANVVQRFWQSLKEKIDQGDAQLLEAAKWPVFYDGFIVLFAQRVNHISEGLKVLQYMITGGHCLPSDLTWSIVISMFLRHGRDQSAEKIRQLMLSRGVPVTEPAWKFILENHPYSEVALEVKKLLEKDPQSEHEADSTISSVESVDITAEQIEEGHISSGGVRSTWSWLEGSDSLVDLGEMKRPDP